MLLHRLGKGGPRSFTDHDTGICTSSGDRHRGGKAQRGESGAEEQQGEFFECVEKQIIFPGIFTEITN